MTDKIARVWNGTEWVVVSSPVGIPNSIAVFQAEPPTTPTDGQIWVDSDTTVALEWPVIGDVGGGSSVTVSDTEPSSPSVGDMWFNSLDGLLYVYYDFFWVEVSGASYIQSQETSMTVALSDESTAIETGTAKLTMRAPFAMTLTKPPRASVSVVSSSGNPSVDINKNGVSIFSTVLSIDAGEKTSVTATTPAVLSTTSIADDEELTFDIDTAGTDTAGLKITIYYEKT